MLENKEDEINALRQENDNLKNNYDALVNEYKNCKMKCPKIKMKIII